MLGASQSETWIACQKSLERLRSMICSAFSLKPELKV